MTAEEGIAAVTEIVQNAYTTQRSSSPHVQDEGAVVDANFLGTLGNEVAALCGVMAKHMLSFKVHYALDSLIVPFLLVSDRTLYLFSLLVHQCITAVRDVVDNAMQFPSAPVYFSHAAQQQCLRAFRGDSHVCSFFSM